MTVVKLKPYIDASMSDDELYELVLRAKQEGTLKTIYYGKKTINITNMIHRIKYDSSCIFMAGYVDGKVAGFGLLDQIRYNTAHAHMCLFKEFWGKSVEIMTEATEQLLTNRFSTLIFIFPKKLGLVNNLMKQIDGVKYQCRIPKYVCNELTGAYEDALMYTISTED